MKILMLYLCIMSIIGADRIGRSVFKHEPNKQELCEDTKQKTKSMG